MKNLLKFIEEHHNQSNVSINVVPNNDHYCIYYKDNTVNLIINADADTYKLMKKTLSN